MKFKLSLICALLMAVGISASAQSIFKTIPKPTSTVKTNSFAKVAIADSALPSNPTDSTFLGFRWTGVTALYALPTSSIYAGTGISYEHDTYHSATKSWYSDWSIGAGLYEGGPLPPVTFTAVTAVGLHAGFFNNHLIVGVLYAINSKKLQLASGPNGFIIPNN
jgi:hypothetical protein